MNSTSEQWERIASECFSSLPPDPAPAELFHYTMKSSAVSIVGSRTLRLSAAEKMRDKTELKVVADICRRVFPHQSPFCDAIQSDRNDPPYRTYILSTAARPDCEHLWQSYADKGAGVALRLGVGSLPDSQEPLGPYIRKVVYDQSAQEALVAQVLAPLLSHPDASMDDLAFMATLLRFTAHLSNVLKGSEYEAEEEWRVMYFRDARAGSTGLPMHLEVPYPSSGFHLGTVPGPGHLA